MHDNQTPRQQLRDSLRAQVCGHTPGGFGPVGSQYAYGAVVSSVNVSVFE